MRATHATLQSLLAAPVSAARVIPHQEQTIQVITLPGSSNLLTTSQPDGAGQVWQVVPNIGNPEIAIIAVADPSELIQATKADLGGTGVCVIVVIFVIRQYPFPRYRGFPREENFDPPPKKKNPWCFFCARKQQI